LRISSSCLLAVGMGVSACSGVAGGDENTGASPTLEPMEGARILAAQQATSKTGGLSISKNAEGQLVVQGMTIVTGTQFGDPIVGLSSNDLALFNTGKTQFNTVEDVAHGLGPVFNGSSCGGFCHNASAAGGASGAVETRFGTTTDAAFDPMTQLGGSLVQVNGIGAVTSSGQTCDYVGEVVPSQATIVAGRLATPLFGAGLIDAVPSSLFASLAAFEARSSPSTAGQVSEVPDLVNGGTSAGRFGWKSQVPTIEQFSGDAYLNEMGLTSRLFPEDNCPQGNCALLACDPVVDVSVGNTAVDEAANFMRFLGPPPIGAITNDVMAGAKQFAAAGCANCHFPVLETGSSSEPALDKVVFAPFSDFLLHDMGSLDDGIGQGAATGSQMRTAPLWGARGRPKYLHDGRTTSLSGAILAHDGQGLAARNAFAALSASNQATLIAFLGAL
jgi:CxxC motif-containing protein (DUF1111 family)